MCRFEHASWVSDILFGAWFLFKTDQALTCDLDLWPWPPICQGHQPVTTGGKSANVTLSSLPMSVPFTLWIERLTLTHFWVIQGQHFCYSVSQVFTDVIFKWRAFGRKASILDPPLTLSQDPNSKFWNLPTYVQDITFQVLAYRLTTPKSCSDEL